MKVEMKITIDYEPNGTPFKEIQSQLDYAASTLAGNGLLSGYLDAEIDTWAVAITDITESGDCEGLPISSL